MNPFKIEYSYNKELYELLSKISKKSRNTKIKSLVVLRDSLDKLDIENNISDITKVLVPLISNETDIELKRPALHIIFDISIRFKNNECIEPIVPKLILMAIDEKNREFLRVYTVKDYIDILLLIINYENNCIVYFKILCIALKYNLQKEEIANIIIRDHDIYNYKSAIDLKYLSNILSYYNDNLLVKDTFIDNIKNINTSNCVQIKWEILNNTFVFFDNQILIEDSKSINIETLKKINQKHDINWDKYKPKDIEVFKYIFFKIENKIDFLCDYIADQKYNHKNLYFNVLEYCDDFDILNSIVDYNLLNVILEYMTNQNIHISDKQRAFVGLTEEQKIERAFVMNHTLDHKPDINIVDANIEKAIFVLPVEFFSENLSNFKNQDAIYRKYPGLITTGYIKSIIYDKDTLCRYLPDINNPVVQKYIKKYMSKHYKIEDYIYVYDNIDLPDYLKMLFYFYLHNVKKLEIRKLDTKVIVDEYFNAEFVLYLLTNGMLILNELVCELYTILGKLSIHNSNFYNHAFYHMNSYFYENIHLTPFDEQTHDYLLFLKETLESIYKIEPMNNSLIFLIFTIDEILNLPCPELEIEITERVKNNLIASKCVFGLKVLLDQERKFLITKEDIKELSNKFQFFKCENLDFIQENEITDKYVLCYIKICTSEKLSKNIIEECLQFKNHRLFNCLLERLTYDQYKNEVEIIFTKESSLETKIDNLCITEKTLVYVEDTNFLSELAVNNSFKYINDYKSYTPILNLIKSDFAWNDNYYGTKQRRCIINILLAPIYRQISFEFIDIYSLTRFEENADESEIFDLMTSNINFQSMHAQNPNFAWNVLLGSMHLIRNINISFFVEKMIEKYSFETTDQQLVSLYAFNFPNIMKTTQSLSELIEDEINHKINNMCVTLLKKKAGYLIKAKYTYEESTFECKIEVDNTRVSKTTFETSVFKKDLLTVKIRSLLQKCYKYMEILSIWKINIDNKMQGMKECLICYLVTDDNTFPDYECKTCSNGFHKKCLSKWAGKSVSFTCPLCRGKFR